MVVECSKEGTRECSRKLRGRGFAVNVLNFSRLTFLQVLFYRLDESAKIMIFPSLFGIGHVVEVYLFFEFMKILKRP
jgi:hypothetical protein